MSADARACAAVTEELLRLGFDVPEAAYGQDLIGLGVNSVALVQVLSALEDRYDADIDMDGLFAAPLTVERMAARFAAAGPPGTAPGAPAPGAAEPAASEPAAPPHVPRHEPNSTRSPVSETAAGYPHLTASGMGALLPWEPGDTLEAAGPRIRRAAMDSGCALVRGLTLDEERFKLLVRSLGTTVDHRFGEGQADLLKLNASREEGKVVTGRGPLPLHTDGLLVGERVDLIILYAAEFSDAPGSGETFVCDQLAAWREMPEALRRVIEERELEYLVTERGYFPTVPESWYTIPTTRDYGRVRSLNLTTAFPPGVLRSWDVRVKGMDGAASERFFAELDAFLHSPRYSYTHRWEVGDLLVIDNQRTLHGRTAISPGGTRVLYRGQLTLARPA